jgi:hypothetical protein
MSVYPSRKGVSLDGAHAPNFLHYCPQCKQNYKCSDVTCLEIVSQYCLPCFKALRRGGTKKA